jgi:AraC-like DNA-binding protein
MSATLHAGHVLPEVWTTEGLPPSRQFDAWRAAIVDAHVKWDISKAPLERFPARICLHEVNGVRLTDCTNAGRVSGTRRAAQIAQDSEAYFNIVVIEKGSAVLRSDGDQELALAAGMFTLRDTTRPMSFTTDGGSEGFQQKSLLVPAAQLLRRLPRVRDLAGVPMDGRHGIGALFTNHFRVLLSHLGELPASSRHPALETTLDLLALCLGQQPALPAPRLRKLVLEQLQRHIEAHLTDRSLGVATLARRFQMTERNIHKIFGDTGETVCAHIRARRLAMCRRDIEGSTLAHRQISEIARHWGFEDPSHFSKVFRNAYGMTPRELRVRFCNAK